MKKSPSKLLVKTKTKVNSRVSAKTAQKKAPFSPRKKLIPMGANKLSQIELPKPRKHWSEYIVSGRIGMITGPHGSGKSTFVLALTLSISYGPEFLDNKPYKPRKTVILDGEMDLHTMQERLKEQAHALGVDIDNTHLKFVSPELFDGIMPNLSTVNGQREIDQAIGSQWDVLFIDNYSAFSESGREDGESWMPWIKWMLEHKRAGRTVIVIHHTGKNGQQRGSSKHEDALDFSISLKPVPDDKHDGNLRFIFEWKKSRHLPSDKTRPFLVTYAKTPDGHIWSRGEVEDANEKMTEANKLHKGGMTQADIATKLGVNKSTVSRWLNKKQ